nr:methionine adenosyltransferase [Mycoplasmopsis iners]
MSEKIYFTSESVGAGHPDKICDQISDAILDAYLKQDPYAHVAVEALISRNVLTIAGEASSTAHVEVEPILEQIFAKLNLTNWYQKAAKTISINEQSPDIKQGVILADEEIGAGDQGIMFGYATNETPSYMPLPITLAHELVKKAEELRNLPDNDPLKFKWAGSDMKSQVSIDYSHQPYTVEAILFSVQHSEDYNEQEFKDFIKNIIIKGVLDKYNLAMPSKIYINPTGKFVIGGPVGDTGLTGRKIIVDTYGGSARHGGGAFSGKDCTKVDRSAAYACRWIAKNLVAAGILPKVEIQVSYAIGVTEPMSISVNTFNYGNKDLERKIAQCIYEVFDLTPAGIIRDLDLRKPIYQQTATFGHFGRDDLDLPWERLNKVEEIKNYFKNS